MKKLLLATTGALCLLTGQALADGYLRQAPAAPCCGPVPSWTGFYLGAGIGAGAVVHDVTFGPPGALGSVNSDGIGGQGIFGTVLVGYDQKLGSSMVAGIFADYDFSNISSDFSALRLFNASLDHKHTWSVGARLGFLSSPATLWYGTAGYTQAQFDIGSSVGSLDLGDFNGYFLGVGAESKLGGGWALRGEYRFTQFESESIFTSPGGFRFDLEPSMHTARLVLTYKFGSP